ncbi:hypothetical protein A2477_03105 [Candidatus Falkowbacteria bacterium RIFOXYC2_FULL_47_12]|uniref:Nudix hydrolase domain-containing protein n=2 Tax=Candidatus Falkowiibacteriota TaxID=1752728 RepID=A0A1F5TR60_9BACT|nr:MAG: hypothetical protein A2242_01800 [Candidatus Falkowbacteria bacterium RIFOXYA2_FULL_47_9]OGF41319.1 MAG: hypothetical protein A2477_03105 [Candidatus Falkowbacteria bacterium RIFOXYC2_FULL_47_12]
MKNPYKILSSKIVHKNPYWYVRDNIVIRPNKTKGHYYVIHKKDGIVIIPLTADKKYTYLVRQWRFAVSENAWEFPMGGLEDDETIFAAAQRELREETGITAKKWTKLKFQPHISNGFMTQKENIFVAQNLTIQDTNKREESEGDMIMKKFSLQKVKEMIETGRIKDSFTIMAFYYFQLNFKK